MYKLRTRFELQQPLTQEKVWRAATWHLVRIAQDQVFRAQAILQHCGIEAWTPCAIRHVRVGRAGSIRPGRQLSVMHRPIHYPALGNYLFIGLTRGEEDWATLFKTGLLRAVVAVTTKHGPRPYFVSRIVMAEAARREQQGGFSTKGLLKSIARDMREGDTVRVTDEHHSWWGHKLRIHAVKEASVCAFGEILGKTVELEIALDAVEKAS